MDLALWAALFLVTNHRSGLDQKTRDVYNALRNLVEGAMYGGQDISRSLAVMSQGDTQFDAFAYQIRDAMQKDDEFARAAWEILRQSDPARMPNGPWVDPTNAEPTINGLTLSQIDTARRTKLILTIVAIVVLVLCTCGLCVSALASN